MKSWEEKAHRIIGALCLKAYREKNIHSDGTRYKKHRPYAVPEAANSLVKCLSSGDEVMAKHIFMYDYEVSQLTAV
jgi:hypothetical protein